jgi:beta-glucosidase
MKYLPILLILLLYLCAALSAGAFASPAPGHSTDKIDSTPVYKGYGAPVEERVKSLLGRLTLAEKIDLLHGNDMETHPIARLGIPALKMTDGPLGVRWGHSTSFPAGIAWAASFDPGLVDRISAALAVETLAHGRDMLLGPCINISRAPRGGRNFESFGEDPFLTSVLAETYVRGLQERGVMASTKHYAANDQEFERMTIDAEVDERTLHEIYLPPFRAALRAGTWTIMASYNRVNGSYASENDALLNRLLKDEWGFKGFVVSDWGATHSTVNAALHGLDLEMPQGDFFGQGKLRRAVEEGKVPMTVIDDKVTRILRAMCAMGVLDRKDTERPPLSAINSQAHQQMAHEAICEGLVLLKNQDSLLPLTPGQGAPRTIALIGPGSAFAHEGGGGSSKVIPGHAVSPLEGFRNRTSGLPFKISQVSGILNPGDIYTFEPDVFTPAADAAPGAHGLLAEYFAGDGLKGTPLVTRIDPAINFSWGDESPDPRIPADHFSVRWTGIFTPKESGEQSLLARNDDGVRLYIDDRLVIDDWKKHGVTTQEAKVKCQAGRPYRIRLEYFEDIGDAQVQLGFVPSAGRGFAEAADLARRSDVAIVFAGFSEALESEGIDRTFNLPDGQDRLIDEVARVNPRTIVVLTSGGSVPMPWVDRVRAVVQAWYPGEQGGNALADLVLGTINPSGKLPVSFYRRDRDVSSYGFYPGKNGTVRYGEGIFVGYRHLDRAAMEPLFPFGFGLSYTQFKMDGLEVRVHDASASSPKIEASIRIINTGARAGAEVVQLYVHDDAPVVPRPVQELKGFQRVYLEPNESRTVKFVLEKPAFAWYDSSRHDWRTKPGTFTLRVGASSRDIREKKNIELKEPAGGETR